MPVPSLRGRIVLCHSPLSSCSASSRPYGDGLFRQTSSNQSRSAVPSLRGRIVLPRQCRGCGVRCPVPTGTDCSLGFMRVPRPLLVPSLRGRIVLNRAAAREKYASPVPTGTDCSLPQPIVILFSLVPSLRGRIVLTVIMSLVREIESRPYGDGLFYHAILLENNANSPVPTGADCFVDFAGFWLIG